MSDPEKLYVVKATPKTELTTEDVKSLERAIEDKLKALAAAEFGRPIQEFIIRKGMPETDLGLTNERWRFSIATANAWNTVISNRKVPDDTIFCFYGGSNLSPDPAS